MGWRPDSFFRSMYPEYFVVGDESPEGSSDYSSTERQDAEPMPTVRAQTRRTESVRCDNGQTIVFEFEESVEGSGVPPRLRTLTFSNVRLDAGLFFHVAAIAQEKDRLSNRVCREHGDYRFGGRTGDDGVRLPASVCPTCRDRTRSSRGHETEQAEPDDDDNDDDDEPLDAAVP